MIVVLLLEDLTGQVVEGNEVRDLLLLYVFYDDGVYDTLLWHKVMAELLLTKFEVDLHILHLLLVESVDLW